MKKFKYKHFELLTSKIDQLKVVVKITPEMLLGKNVPPHTKVKTVGVAKYISFIKYATETNYQIFDREHKAFVGDCITYNPWTGKPMSAWRGDWAKHNIFEQYQPVELAFKQFNGIVDQFNKKYGKS